MTPATYRGAGRRRMAVLAGVLGSLVLCILFAGCTAGSTSGRYTVTLITEDEHSLGAQAPAPGDVVIIGGIVTIESGSALNGSVYLLGGTVRVSGRIDGTLTAFAGTATLSSTAVVAGDLVEAGGAVVREPGSVILGRVVEEPNPAAAAGTGADWGFGERLLLWAAGVLLMAGLGALAGLAVPRPIARVAAAARYPLVAGALGALVLISALPLMAAMIFTLFLIPIAIVVLVILGVGVAYGLIGTGRNLGELIARRRNRAWSPSVTTGIGTAIVTAVLLLVGEVPILGVIVTAATVMVALGSAFLTAFGLRSFTPPADFDEDVARGSR